MTAGGTAIPEVQRLLCALAAGKRVAEAGAAFGETAALMAQTATTVVTAELDRDREQRARERLRGVENVTLLHGDWRTELPPHGPVDLLFLDAGTFKHEPAADGPRAIGMLAPGGLLVIDDLTPGVGDDLAREYLFGHPQLAAAEVLTTPRTAAIVAARLG
jgi:predicted O-methyltransferase YrrM